MDKGVSIEKGSEICQLFFDTRNTICLLYSWIGLRQTIKRPRAKRDPQLESQYYSSKDYFRLQRSTSNLQERPKTHYENIMSGHSPVIATEYHQHIHLQSYQRPFAWSSMGFPSRERVGSSHRKKEFEALVVNRLDQLERNLDFMIGAQANECSRYDRQSKKRQLLKAKSSSSQEVSEKTKIRSFEPMHSKNVPNVTESMAEEGQPLKKPKNRQSFKKKIQSRIFEQPQQSGKKDEDRPNLKYIPGSLKCTNVQAIIESVLRSSSRQGQSDRLESFREQDSQINSREQKSWGGSNKNDGALFRSQYNSVQQQQDSHSNQSGAQRFVRDGNKNRSRGSNRKGKQRNI